MDWSTIYAPGWHPFWEALAYLIAGLLYRHQRRKQGDVLDIGNRLSVIVAAVAGAAIGSKLLHHLASPAEVAEVFHQGGWNRLLPHLSGGKTIVGALLGGWLAVEWMKKRKGIQTRTGDLFALPLIIGMMIGRIGCLMAGPMDDTVGVPTTMPWGISYGEGVLRHPTALYEILFLAGLLLVLSFRRFAREGDSFRIFLLSYLIFRFAVDFWKDYQVVMGLRILQWACLLGISILCWDLFQAKRTSTHDQA